jgi:uncharacterized protein YjiS (DUF1127 family)
MEAAMFERIKALMERWHDVKEINELSERDLDDLGMSREQVQAFARMPRDITERVKHMAAIFGLSDAELQVNHDAYLEILSTCGNCRDRTKCAHLLAQGADASPLEAEFCLNFDTFNARAEQPVA